MTASQERSTRRRISRVPRLAGGYACAYSSQGKSGGCGLMKRGFQMAKVDRRKLLKAAGSGGLLTAAGTALPPPAIAQAAPELRWRLTSSFPTSLDTIHGAAKVFSQVVREMTDNRF